MALYLDDTEAVQWWHRLVAKQDYHLQGWQRNKVYPDFLACVTSSDNGLTFSILETKGAHLKGNDDTQYKERLFDLLSKIGEHALEAGEVELGGDASQRMTFKILLNPTWRERSCLYVGKHLRRTPDLQHRIWGSSAHRSFDSRLGAAGGPRSCSWKLESQGEEAY